MERQRPSTVGAHHEKDMDNSLLPKKCKVFIWSLVLREALIQWDFSFELCRCESTLHLSNRYIHRKLPRDPPKSSKQCHFEQI